MPEEFFGGVGTHHRGYGGVSTRKPKKKRKEDNTPWFCCGVSKVSPNPRLSGSGAPKKKLLKKGERKIIYLRSSFAKAFATDSQGERRKNLSFCMRDFNLSIKQGTIHGSEMNVSVNHRRS